MVPTAWQDEALARDGVSREVPCSALKGVATREESRVLGFPSRRGLTPRGSLVQPWALSLPDKELCLREALAPALNLSQHQG